MKVLKWFAMAAVLGCAAMCLSGCGFFSGGEEGEGTDSVISNLLGGEKILEASVEGNTLTYGTHVYKIVAEIDPATREFKQPTACVTFTNIPAGYGEFEAVYKGLLGKSRAGTAAMIPMALEMYARDAEVGTKCLQLLCNSSATVSNITGILKTKLVPSQYAPDNDPYIQRYMAAALLKGAVNTNGYTPDKPYTVEMTMSPNGVKDAPLTGGEVTYMYILAQGWDSFQRGVEVFLPYDTDYYKVFNCSSCYVQCKNIRGSWEGLQ